MTSDEYVCPVCKQAVDTVVRRHKTLGVFVPLWGAGPCQNPECAEYEEGEAEKAEAESERVLASEPETPQAAAGQGPADQASVERDS
ncbi:hypothetical protein GCM10010306_011660 [Streptomyces umbrinus]|uniref:hypothetical protein n=1 Tax=Streptomyces umbrinus TaxID=67370 RepID=UPI0016732A4A|nr:hypothetical protein [Streptomyces umbrinus]GHB20766.1 hypothetical protein GCM10010306_011660 [Streptomyces umbrinus]